MSIRRRIALRTYLIPLTLATAFYLPGILFKFWLHDAGLYAAVSLRMARTGEWWTPMQANATYFNKPPLAFWVHALLVRVLGEADWVLRLPELLSALACVALIVSIAKRLQGPRVGMMAGLILAVSVQFIWYISRFRLDFMHTALMLAAVRMVVEGACKAANGQSSKAANAAGARWIVLAGVPVGMAMLVKPLFGLLALMLAAVWMAVAGATTRARLKWIPVAVLVAVVTAAPWHVGMWVIHGDAFAQRFFIHESAQRATGEKFGAEPWWAYLRYLAVGSEGSQTPRSLQAAALYWPIMLCAVMAIVWWARGRRLARRLSTRGGLLAQVYTLGFFAALCAFGDKKPWYLIPVIPGIAWIAAMWVTTVTPRSMMRAFQRVIGPASVAMLTVTLARGLRFERGEAKPLDTSQIRAFIAAHPEGDYWSGSLWRYENAPLYIRTGVWPKLIEDPNTGRRWEPPVGSYVIYDTQKPPAPDPRDEVVVNTGRFVMVKRSVDELLPRVESRP